MSTPIDDKQDALARGMDSAASALRDRVESMPGGERLASAADTTADAIESAAEYVRDADLSEMLADVRRIVKDHPGATLLAVAAAGFLLARAIARN